MPPGQKRPKRHSAKGGVEYIKKLPTGNYVLVIDDQGKLQIEPGARQTRTSGNMSTVRNIDESEEGMDYYDPNNPYSVLGMVETKNDRNSGVFNIKKPPPIIVNSQQSLIREWLNKNEINYTAKNLSIGVKLFFETEEHYKLTLQRLE